MTIKKSFLALSLAALVAAAAIPASAKINANVKAQAETDNDVKSGMSVMINPAGHAQIQGKVSAISSSSISVTSWGGTWNANLSGNASSSASSSMRSNIANVKIGDEVILSGWMTGTNTFTVTNANIKDLSLRANGRIEASSTGNGNYAVTLKNGEIVNISVGSSSASTTAIEGRGIQGIITSLVHKLLSGFGFGAKVGD